MRGRLPRHGALAARWSRLAGRLGFDHNPLRRRTDRVESAARLLTAVVMLIAVPAAGLATGRFAEHRAVGWVNESGRIGAAPLGRSQVIWAVARQPARRPR